MAKKASQTMDMTQASQMLQWLDEERRKDKATIATLQEQAREQEQQLSQTAAQIQDLQAKAAGFQSLISQAADFEQTVSNYKNELVFLVDQREETRKKEQAESERLRKIEYESISDHLGKLDKEMQVLPRYDEKLNARQAEEQRLSEALQRLEATVSDLNKRSDDRVQAVTYLEEQRRADNRRIAELEHDTTDMHKKLNVQATKLPLLEEMIQKQKAHTNEALQEIKAFEKPLAELRASDFQREQKMKQYLDQGELVAQEMERILLQTQGFVEHQNLVKRALEKTEGLQARIEKRQNEVAEMQRLAEDRVKRQWEEWQTEQVKEKKKQDILTGEHQKQQEQINEEHRARLAALKASAERHRAQLSTLWETRRADASRALKAIQDKHEARSSQADEQLGVLRGEQ